LDQAERDTGLKEVKRRRQERKLVKASLGRGKIEEELREKKSPQKERIPRKGERNSKDNGKRTRKTTGTGQYG